MKTQAQIDKMVELRLEGQTLQQIGDRFNLTRERVRQLLVAAGVMGVPWLGYQPVHYRRLARTIASVAYYIDHKSKPREDGFPHGTLRGYRRGCSCEPCRTASREWNYKTNNIVIKTPRPEWRVPRGRSRA